ncbi:MAG: hypothetical protein WAP03_18620 [Methylorubrum rhodinum]|uniref:DUF6950 family protein n=1 Tax=Methylorubrum rhodinum TaxID=29428 RepID=UPI003BAEB355
MGDRLLRLDAFLRDAVHLPFVWGERDCSLWACDWIRAERGVDPAEALRGTYASRLACARLLREAGGLPALAGTLAAQAGLIEIDTAEAGDVGVIELPTAAYLALSTGTRWAFKAADGLAVAPARPIRMWAV